MRKNEGFTLIELMIVVVIIGILASISIPQFRKYQLRSKTSEASRNLGTIRMHEEAVYAKWLSYVVATPAPRAKAAIVGAPGVDKAAWVSTAGFQLLGFAAQGGVYYSYSIPDTAQLPSGALGADCALAEGAADSAVDSTNPLAPVLTPQILRDTSNPPLDVITPIAAGNLDGDLLTMCWVTGNENTQVVADPSDGGDNVF